MRLLNVEQGSPEWFNARLGIPTASEFCKIITPTGKESTQADGYANRLVAELLIGKPVSDFEGNEWTERGKELEPDAVAFYEMSYGILTHAVGFIMDDEGTMGASPDRLVGEDGLLEIKCPSPQVHVQNMLNKRIDTKYIPQVQGQLLVTGRKWVDWLSYHPEMPPVIIRVERDEKYLEQMAVLMKGFRLALNDKITQLQAFKEAA